MYFSPRNWQADLKKFIWKWMGLRIIKTTLKKKSQRTHDSWFQSLVKSYHSQNSVILYRIDIQINKKKLSHNALHLYLLGFNDAKTTIVKRMIFSKWYEDNWIFICKIMKLNISHNIQEVTQKIYRPKCKLKKYKI